MGLRKSTLLGILSVVCSLSILSATSCSDSEEFVSSASTVITFSADTVSFDTVFTDVGSATKEFKIYNPNNKGVRFTSVRLGSNGSSGFRVNLDGQYNTQFTDVEIYHDDSLYCFVEVTVSPHDSDSPILITDSLLFSVEGGKTYKVMLQAWGQDVYILQGKTYEESDTLRSVRPIVVLDSLVVGKGATLVIDEGTTLCFHKGAGLAVHGTLRCNGTQEKPVVMRGDRTDKLFPYLPYDRLDAQWEGVYLHPESYDNSFIHCDIHGGNYGIIAATAEPEQMKCSIKSSKINSVYTYGLYLQNAKADIVNSQISNGKSGCVTVIGGYTTFTHCTVAQFSSGTGPALQFANVADKVEYPLQLIEFRNSIITGYANDEIYGTRNFDSDAAFNYMFRNCLVNTKITDEEAEFFPNCIFDSEDKNKDKDREEDEKVPVREGNFIVISTYAMYYDFHLDSLSVARHLGNHDFITPDCEADLDGKIRPERAPDAGCYQSEWQ